MFYEDEDEVMSDAGGREEMSPDRVGEEEEEEKVQSPEWRSEEMQAMNDPISTVFPPFLQMVHKAALKLDFSAVYIRSYSVFTRTVPYYRMWVWTGGVNEVSVKTHAVTGLEHLDGHVFDLFWRGAPAQPHMAS